MLKAIRPEKLLYGLRMDLSKTLAGALIVVGCMQILAGCSGGRANVDRFRYPVLKEREGGSIFEARRRVIDAYRLKPDARVTAAIGEIYTIQTSKPEPEVKAQLDGRVWRLSCEGVEVGSLPDRPTFVQSLTMLKSWAKKLSPTSPAPAAGPITSSTSANTSESSSQPPPSLPIPSPIAALRDLHQTSQQTLQSASQPAPHSNVHSACSLAFLCFDRTEVADLIATRALALLSLEDWQETGHAKAAAMLAYSMGYGADAQSLASLVSDENDPFKLYVARKTDALARLAFADGAGEEAKYLYLRSLSERKHDAKAWISTMRKLLGNATEWTLPVVSLLCSSSSDRRARLNAADALIAASLAELRVHSGETASPPAIDMLESPSGMYSHIEDPTRSQPDSNPGDRAQLLDQKLNSASFRSSPLWKDDRLWRAYYQAVQYSALFEIGTYCVQSSQTQLGMQFVSAIGSREGDAAQQFHKMMADTLAASIGDRNPAKLRDDISLAKSFGGAVKTWLFQNAANLYAPDEPPLYAAGRRLFASLDARPGNLKRMSTVCHDYLLNLPLSDSLVTAFEGTGQQPQLEPELVQDGRTLRAQKIQDLAAQTTAFWKKGSYSDAAKLMHAYKYPLTWVDWRWSVGPRFVESFQEKQDEALKAANTLFLYGFDSARDCGQLAVAASDGREYQLAFEIDSRLLTAATRGQELENLSSIAHAYKCLKHLKTATEAKAWLDENVPAPFRNPLSMFAFHLRQYDLLWDAVDAEPSGFGAEFVWMVRAAAAIDNRQKIPAAEKKSTIAHFNQSRSSPEFYYEVGRYLLSLGDASELKSRNLDSKQMLEAAYFLGWKAESESRYEEAGQWYYTALETGQTAIPEYEWAYEKLRSWRDKEDHHK